MPIFVLIFVNFMTRTLTTRFHVKITHNSFYWFSIRLFDTVKYELIVLYFIYDDTHSKFQSQVWTNLLNQTLFVCQNNKGYDSFEYHVKIYSLNENVDKIHNAIMLSCFVKQPNFWNDLLVLILWRQTYFHLFT